MLAMQQAIKAIQWQLENVKVQKMVTTDDKEPYKSVLGVLNTL